MQNWQQFLNGYPLLWQLDPETPSVRYWTLNELLDQPTNDPEVQETRAVIAQQPLVREMFALQHAEGYCGEDGSKPYTAQGA